MPVDFLLFNENTLVLLKPIHFRSRYISKSTQYFYFYLTPVLVGMTSYERIGATALDRSVI